MFTLMLDQFPTPPCPPVGHLSWRSAGRISPEDRERLDLYRARMKPMYDDPRTTLELCFCNVLYEEGIFLYPPKMKWWRSIWNFFANN